ncbi:MAG: phage major capsid protein [Clostridia bacterium]|nr:phage major capsid protein [Clostridia bacterium]
MVTTHTADNALKSYYLDVVSDQLNTAVNPLLAKIKMSTADVWGRDVRKLVRFGVNGGIGAGTEDGALPTAGGNNYAQFVASLKNLYGTVEISDKAIRASANNEGAFVNLLNDEMEGLVKSSAFNFGRMLFGDGSGKLATVSSASGSVYTVDTVAAVAEGMIVDVYQAGSAVATARKITAVDRAKRTVTLSGAAITDAVGSIFVVQNSYGLEITGLQAIFSDSDTLYGVSRAQNGWMNAYKQTNVGAITEGKIQKAIDYLEEVSGSGVNFIVCSWGVRRALAEALAKYKQAETMTLEGGFRAISFNGIPVFADRFCPEGTMYLLNTDDFCLHQLCDWQWLEGEDGKILRQKAGKPVYTATLVKYAELICSRPCGQAMLTGITEA